MSQVLTSQNFLKVSWSISKIDLIEVHATKANSSTYLLLWIFERSICWCCDDLFLKWKWWFKSKVKLSFILHHHFVLGSLLLHVMSHYNYHNDDCYVGTWVFFSQITFLQRIAPLNTAATTQLECWVTLLGIAPHVIKHQSRQALTKTE